MRPGRTLVAVLLATLVVSTAATGQVPSPTGNLFGRVSDEQSRPLAGVTVLLSGPGAAQAVNTGANGDFHFLSLSPGDYSIALERAGFETVHRSVAVALGRNAVLSVLIPVAGATEAVTVSGEAPVIDTPTTQTGASFSRKELDDIPTTRDPWGVLRQVPGVLLGSIDNGGAYTGQQPTFVGKGSHADQNTYNLDGVGVSIAGFTPLFFDFDSLDSVGIATGGSDPSLSSPGVTLNLVTKRGTNQLHGSARGLYTDGARWDYGAEAGGPLWKDHLWLWGAGASNSYLGQTFSLPPDDEPVRYQETQSYWNAKLSAQLVASNSLTLSYLKWERFADGRGADWGDRSEQSTWDNTFPGQSFKLEDSQVFSEKLFGSLVLSYLPADNIKTPKGGLHTQAGQDAYRIWRNSFYEWDVAGVQRQAGVTASAFFDTGDLRHELKFGFGYRQAHWDSATVWPADQLVGYAFDPPPQYAEITRASNRYILLHYYDTYLGDTVRAGNLTVNAGARFDYQQGKNRPSSVPANPALPELLPAVHYGGDSGYPITWRAVQPRVGATYALGKDGRTLLRASYARFANQLGLEVGSINAFPGTASLAYYWNDANADGRVDPGEIEVTGGLKDWSNVNPGDPGSSTPINQISKSLKPPTTNEFIVGIERQIASALSFSIAYTHRSLGNPLFAPLIGTTRASYEYIGNAEGAVASDGFALSFSEPYYGLVECPDPCAGTVLQNRPDASETYSGIELQLLKSFSHGWMARVSFAYNDWQQHIGPGAIVNPNNETPGTNANGPVVDSGDIGSGGGASVINATWQFNVSGTVELPLGIQAGLNLFGRQGFPTPYFVEAVTEDLKDNRPLIQIGQATDYRTPNVYVLDLQLSRIFLIGSSVAVSPVIACFNILNSQTVLARDGFVGTFVSKPSPAFFPNTGEGGSFNAPIEALSGRTVRVGVRVSF